MIPPGMRMTAGGMVPQKETHAGGCPCRICRRVRRKIHVKQEVAHANGK